MFNQRRAWRKAGAGQPVISAGGEPQVTVERTVRPMPDRYRNALGKYKIGRSADCVGCGDCVKLCPEGVHVKPDGYTFSLRPRDHLCIGPDCAKTDHYCVAKCPKKALSMAAQPDGGRHGRSALDLRTLILSTWHMAETGHAPKAGLEHRVGASGGGFDRIGFNFPAVPPKVDPAKVDTGLDLNRRNDGRPQVHIDLPVYGGGMSFGSVSIHTILAKARAATAWNIFTCTGEGGYHDRFKPYDDHVITQVATGLFGVREDTIQRVRIVEFKYAQGAKPGLGGHLLGDKNTPAVARMREAVAGNALFSPFPFHSVYSVEDHKKHLDWIKEVNPRALVSVKVSTPTDVDMVAVGSYYAGAHIIHLDGSYGGTGAAPDIAKKNIAMPIEYAIPKVHKFLVAEGIRDEVTLIVSGGIRTAWDVMKAIALGADGVVIGTAEMVALGCVRCACCESGRGCPRGIASTDPELMMQMSLDWATQRLINLMSAWREQMVEILVKLGIAQHARAAGPDATFSITWPTCRRLSEMKRFRRTAPGDAVGSVSRRRAQRRRAAMPERRRAAAASRVLPARCRSAASSSTSRRSRCRTAATARAVASRRSAWCPSRWASRETCSIRITCCRSRCWIRRRTTRSSRSSCCRTSMSRCRPSRYRTSTITATFRAWKCGRRTCTATWCGSSRRCCGRFGEGEWPGQAFAARPGRRVRLAQLVPAERHVLRVAGRKARLRAVARPRPNWSSRWWATPSRTCEYYKLEDFKAHVWIAHQRYPTKGRVWHPGGAHPFVGINEALVHNGDFANYHSVCEYLRQRNIKPAVPDRHRGVGAAVRPVGPRLQVSAGVHHRGAGADHGAGFRPAAHGKAAHLPRRFRPPTSTPRPTGRGSSSSPAAIPITSSSSCWASPTRPCCGRRCSRFRRVARCRSA